MKSISLAPCAKTRHTLHTPRIHGLDTLRALAIVLVFMNHHLLFVSPRSPFGWLGQVGWVGVDLFFALSGYLIGNQIFSALRSPQGFSLPRFYARRFLRTLPNFYVVLALYALWPWFRAGAQLPPVWEFLTFTQNIGLMPGTAFSHAWSLCVEEQFYVLLPAVALVIAACRHPRHAGMLAWLAVIASFAAGMAIRSELWRHQLADDGGYHYYSLVYYASWCRFDELVAGVALALLKNYHAPLWARMTSRGNATLAAGCALTGLAWFLFLDDHYSYGMTVLGYPLLALGCSTLLVAALSPDSMLARIKVPGAATLALWSYAIYLLHKQVCILLKPELAQLSFAPQSWASAAIMAAASLLAGALLYWLVETPFMRLRDAVVPAVSPLSGASQSRQTHRACPTETPAMH